MIDEKRIEKFRRVILQRLSEELSDYLAGPPTVELSLYENFLTDEITLRIVGEVWGQKLEYIEIKYPSDWKQAVKERFLPQWVRQRWPVIYTTHTVDVRAIYKRSALPEGIRIIVDETVR